MLSIRTELLDHVVVLNEAHARRLLVEYVAYHRQDRCHLALNKDSPVPRAVHPPDMGEVVELPQVGGLHPPPPRWRQGRTVGPWSYGVTGHRYERRAAA